MLNWELYKEWISYGDIDQESAEILLGENGPANTICFLSQQIAEKYLKGFIVLNEKKFEKTHSLRNLLDMCIELEATLSELKPDVRFLENFYIEPRYPGDIPHFDFSQAKEALPSALRVAQAIIDSAQKLSKSETASSH